MTPIKRTALACLIVFFSCPGLAATPGFATRDLNPVLQPIFLPGYFNLSAESGWHIEHSFYITNTTQEDEADNEFVIIDAENYRYELMLGYRYHDWVVQSRLPFIATEGGQLDQTIEKWHDIFGFPEGDRKDYSRDQVNIQYIRDGVVEYSQADKSNGIGDLSIAVGHHPAGQVGYFVGIELPTGSESDFTGNEGIDLSFWLLGDAAVTESVSVYGLFGITFPADDGALEGLVADEIWVAQAGLTYRYNDDVLVFSQLDLHTQSIDGSDLEPFAHSLQIQLGLGFDNLFDDYRLDLFFSEDIAVGTAPDITFSLRLAHTLN